MPDEMDVHRLIAEVKKRPTLWDVRFSEYKDRTNTPQMWHEISEILGFDVEHCKRKWKNLRDAYRAEVRRAERRIRLKAASGQTDAKPTLTSKWVYFEPMSFINETKRGMKYSSTVVTVESNSASLDENPDAFDPAFQSFCDIKMEPHATTDEEEEEADDILFEEFNNVATPQAARRVSFSIANAAAAAAAAVVAPSTPMSSNEPAGPSCKCSRRTEDQVHFLENLEREEQTLMQSTRQDMTRANTLGHVGDGDYNFLVSFLPQMKKMSELQNLQFRAKMSEHLLSIMTPPPPAVSVQPLCYNPPNALTISTTTPTQGQVMQLPLQRPQQQPDTMDTENSAVPAVATSSSDWP